MQHQKAKKVSETDTKLEPSANTATRIFQEFSERLLDLVNLYVTGKTQNTWKAPIMLLLYLSGREG